MALVDSIQWMQSGQQRIQSFAFVVSVCICVLLSCGFVLNVGAAGQASEIQLDSRINPNDAPAASLVRLSGIGPVRAAAIVAYRDSFSEKDGSARAFRDCNDLQNVKGIGPKTAQNISEWLKFD
ncbi:MAG: helix-hairpin-helix domain-containing protein [Planctomycetes bacterium]|nr:helix-hairpin-helix domain-containing protein [Planctomycetota bacterium]